MVAISFSLFSNVSAIRLNLNKINQDILSVMFILSQITNGKPCKPTQMSWDDRCSTSFTQLSTCRIVSARKCKSIVSDLAICVFSQYSCRLLALCKNKTQIAFFIAIKIVFLFKNDLQSIARKKKFQMNLFG